jgi:phospholipase/carboxylesterase
MKSIIHLITIALLISCTANSYNYNTIMSEKNFNLPERVGDAPQIGQTPPQLQFSDKSPRAIYQLFHDWMFSTFLKVRKEPTRISVSTSTAMWLDENEDVGHIDAFMPPSGGREFTHIHLDGSFHTVVSSEVENEIIAKKWGVRHMYYNQGVKEVLVYAPRNEEEIEIAKTIVIKSYEYATGKKHNE